MHAGDDFNSITLLVCVSVVLFSIRRSRMATIPKIALAVFNNVPGAISDKKTMLHKTEWLHYTYLVGVPTLNRNHNGYITSPVGVVKAPRDKIGNPAFSGSGRGWNQNGYITVALGGSQ